MPAKPPLDGTNALLTGASSGIGRELARLLAPRVQGLALVARREDRLQELARELRGLNPNLQVHSYPTDLGDPTTLQPLVDAATRDLGEIDVLLNNAGLGYHARYDEAAPERLQQVLAVDLTTPLLLTRMLLPGMVARGRGGILNIGSGAGFAPMPGAAAYVAAKFALTGFSETLRLELEGTGVAVTLVAPGPVPTEFNQVAGIASDEPFPVPAVSAAQCAQEALSGFERGQAVVYPGAVYRLMMRGLSLTPRWLVHLAARPMVVAMNHKRRT